MRNFELEHAHPVRHRFHKCKSKGWDTPHTLITISTNLGAALTRSALYSKRSHGERLRPQLYGQRSHGESLHPQI
ncbi:hypothetical protein Y032_0068g170 [Ancylostoma ceylanicum]|uniref:Uncharacterized protein n=1 Tax=Ancylostoma ceylanicum TaxID=53326 RepID=A0A016TZ07_9BILA|nr:hypothetical protein Y032_0068g170 [Ancylostoma ceylanicum]